MKSVAIIGMGTMGSAIHERLAGSFLPIGIGREDDIAAAREADMIMLAVKPQSFTAVATELRKHISKQAIFSVMAGVSLRSMIESLGTDYVVRTMPNLALKTGESITAWYSQTMPEGAVRPTLDCWGESVALLEESQFNAFTALAGSGPAYFYELARLLEANALRYGFGKEQALQIGLQTLRGAASVLGSEDDPQALVQQVASKGGTTEAALRMFAAHGLENVVNVAVDAAVKRCAALSE